MNNKKSLKIGQEQHFGGKNHGNINIGGDNGEFYRKMAQDLRGGRTSQLKISTGKGS
jgi:hypothetical protein